MPQKQKDINNIIVYKASRNSWCLTNKEKKELFSMKNAEEKGNMP